MRNIHFPFVCAIAGVSWRQDVVVGCAAGDVLDLVAVDDNPHDAHAVEVRTTDGRMVGFVPAAIAARLRTTAQRRWSAVITDVLTGDKAWGLRIRVDRHDTPVSLASLSG